MPSLTSCYFCGDVGASLEEYELPEDAPPEDRVSVSLCVDCHGKLTTLFEQLERPSGNGDGAPTPSARGGTPPAASDAAGSGASSSEAEAGEDAGADSDAEADSGAAADSGVESDSNRGPDLDDESVPDDESELDDEADTSPEIELDTEIESDVEADPTDDSSVEPTVVDPDLDPVAGEQEPIFADEDGTLFEEDLEDVEQPPFGGADEASERDDARTAEGSATEDSSTEETTSDDDPIAAPPATDDREESAEDDESDDGSRDAPAVQASAGGSGTTTRSTSGTDGGSTDDGAQGPLADVSPRTYNRVVRLLQNREFPVDRADFEALATSAYELDHGECAAALDGAIEKGLLEERDGKLHRPE